FDGVVTKAVTHELNQTIKMGRVNRIFQPTSTEVAINIRSNRQNYVLLVSIDPSCARVDITNDDYRNPGDATLISMVVGKVISGDIDEMTLVMDLMGRHSNLILLNEDKRTILESIKHIPSHINRHRTILPGATYIPPPAQDKLNPLTSSSDDFLKKLDFNSGK